MNENFDSLFKYITDNSIDHLIFKNEITDFVYFSFLNHKLLNDLDLTYEIHNFVYLDDFKFEKVKNYINTHLKNKKNKSIKIIDEEKNVLYSMSLMKSFEVSYTFQERLYYWMNKKELNSPDLWKRANIDRKLFSKIYTGNNPSKNTATLIALTLELNLDDTLDLLKTAGYTLSDSILKDVIISYYIKEKNFNIYEIEEVLQTYSVQSLF